MKRGHVIMMASALVCIGLAVLGIQWRSWDYDMMRDLDYRRNSRCILRHDAIDTQEYLTQIRKMMKNNNVCIIREYSVGDYVLEIIGQSGKYWLTSNYLDKFTIASVMTRREGTSETPRWQFLVYSVSSESGSRAFLSIVFLCFMIIVASSVKKKYLPHIFPQDEI